MYPYNIFHTPLNSTTSIYKCTTHTITFVHNKHTVTSFNSQYNTPTFSVIKTLIGEHWCNLTINVIPPNLLGLFLCLNRFLRTCYCLKPITCPLPIPPLFYILYTLFFDNFNFIKSFVFVYTLCNANHKYLYNYLTHSKLTYDILN